VGVANHNRPMEHGNLLLSAVDPCATPPRENTSRHSTMLFQVTLIPMVTLRGTESFGTLYLARLPIAPLMRRAWNQSSILSLEKTPLLLPLQIRFRFVPRLLNSRDPPIFDSGVLPVDSGCLFR
jgi:hypothetical protein